MVTFASEKRTLVVYVSFLFKPSFHEVINYCVPACVKYFFVFINQTNTSTSTNEQHGAHTAFNSYCTHRDINETEMEREKKENVDLVALVQKEDV